MIRKLLPNRDMVRGAGFHQNAKVGLTSGRFDFGRFDFWLVLLLVGFTSGRLGFWYILVLVRFTSS